MMIIWRFCTVLLLIIGFATACNPDDENGGAPRGEDPLEPKPAVTTTISGTVVDEEGMPVSNAEIAVYGQTYTTGQDGGFLLTGIEVPGNRCVVTATKEGYFPATRAHEPRANGRTDMRLVLMASPVTHSFDAGSGIDATLDNGSTVRIDAGSLVTPSGAAYTGQVSMSVRYMDPTAGNFGILVPGGDMVARREDESTSILYSYGILRVVMTGDAGEVLQLGDNKTSQLTMDIPDDQLATAPETIPLWYFDEVDGVWVEDGSATREGNRYVGTVTHFTDWNCDDPTEGATIVGRLVDCDGNPAWGQVEFGQVASDPQSSTETGETDGKFSRRVPSGVPITVVISDPLMITPLTADGRGKVVVTVPPLAEGQVYDVGDIQTFPCASKVKASIQTPENDAVFSVYFMSDNGVKNIYQIGDPMETTLPPDQSFSMTIYTNNGLIFSQEINTPGPGETLDLGVINISGDVNISEEVTIKGKTLCFGESENEGQISVSWVNESGTAYNYTSPEADGTFQISAPANQTVTVRSSTEHGNWERVVETGDAGLEIDLGTFEICENDMLGETTFQINGDGYNNTVINIVQNINLYMLNGAIYYPSEDLTIGYATDMSEDFTVTFHFSGNETGMRTNDDNAGVTIRIVRDGEEVMYWAHPDMPESTLNLNVTKFDDVGGVIEGTFSGTFVKYDGTMTGTKVTITNGKFSVIRYSNPG